VKTTSQIVRALFFVVVFLGYTQTTKAWSPYFNCDTPSCIGFLTQATRCYFTDYDHGNWDTCQVDAATYFENFCKYLGGDPNNYWFGLEECADSTGDPEGEFYCSYVSSECQ